MLKDFHVLFLMLNCSIYSISSIIIELKVYPFDTTTLYLVDMVIQNFIFTLFAFAIIFVDAIPLEVFPVKLRIYYCGVTLTLCTMFATNYIFFSEAIEISVLGKKWLITDIQASSWMTTTIFIAKMFISNIMHPNAMVLCTARLERSQN